MAEQHSTLVVHLCQAGTASKSDAVLHKELLELWVYKYIRHAIHHHMVVTSCPLSSVIHVDDLQQNALLLLSH